MTTPVLGRHPQTTPYPAVFTSEEIWNLAVDTNLVCPYYDYYFFSLGEWQRDVMVDVAGGLQDKVVLDIGCGGMRFGAFILPYLGNGHYYGVDPMPRFLAFSRKLAEYMGYGDRVTLISSKTCEFPSGIAVDFAMSQSVFTHMSAPQILDCLEKLLPVMKPGGKLVMTYILTQQPTGHHEGRLYQEKLPVICAYLPGTRIFADFAKAHGLTFEDGYDMIPHPTQQRTAILTF